MPMARFLFYFLMHVLDYIFDRLSRLLRFNNYPLIEKDTVMFYAAGLSFRDLSERYCVTIASKEVLGDDSIDSLF